MMQPNGKVRNNTGLSLFELLIAIALLALIAVGLASSLNLGVHVYERSRKISTSENEYALRIRLRDWLTHAASPKDKASIPIVFAGTDTRLEFVTLTATGAVPEAAVWQIIIQYENDRLELTAIALDDLGAEITRHGGTLARGVKSAKFSYFDLGVSPVGWRDDWAEGKKLPDLIRIEIPPGSTPNWPEFTVRTRLK